MFELLLSGFGAVFSLNILVLVTVGVAVGIVFGAVPGLKSHPIKKMLDAGVRVSVGTDDLLFFDQSVSTQIFNLVSERVITPADAETLLSEGL